MNSAPTGVLFVGSVPFDSTKDVFTKLCDALPDRLHTIPDGEVGTRSTYVIWQRACFPQDALSGLLGPVEESSSDSSQPVFTLDSVKPTGYDEAAIASYAEFCELREAGHIPSTVRFQVCLPTPFNSLIGHCRPEMQPIMEPFYEMRLGEAIQNIVNTIPHDDLVIQWDLAFDILAIEYDRGNNPLPFCKAYFEPAKEGIIDRWAKMVTQYVPTDVPVAIHLCYGDYKHKHMVEPENTAVMVDLANDMFKAVKSHRIEWVHMPVPKDRSDAAYFEPLANLQLPTDTKLYLGLVHANDEEGTRERIEAAQSVYPHAFGVANECGLGRTPLEEIESILTISKNVTTPRQVSSKL